MASERRVRNRFCMAAPEVFDVSTFDSVFQSSSFACGRSR